MNNLTALITGASSGIGLELAKVFASYGYNLVIIARSTDKLEQLAHDLQIQHNTKSKIITKDLSKPTASQEIYDELQKNAIHIDVLVNNAGFGNYGDFASVDLIKQNELLQLNIVTVTNLTHLFLKDMQQRRSGKILNISSTAGFLPGPFLSTYYASKAYVLSFSESLAEELRGTGITVTCLCPGVTKTNFAHSAGAQNTKAFATMKMSAANVAKIGYSATIQGKPLVIAGVMNKVMVFAIRFSPRWLSPKVVRYFLKTKAN